MSGDHQLISCTFPLFAEAMSKLVLDVRFWGGSKPCHNLHVVSHVALSFEAAVAVANELMSSNAKLPDKSVNRIAGYPKRLVSDLIRALPLSIELDPKAFTQVLHIVALPQGAYGVGCCPREHYPATDFSEQMSKGVCRAYFKMQEAATTWPDVLMESERCRFKSALDLGSAPGGWTQWLVQDGGVELCVAVDPGEMNAGVLKYPGVVHTKETIEAAAASGVIEKLKPPGGFELVVCDINGHPVSVAKAIESLLPWLAPHATLIMTLKQVTRGAKAGEKLEHETRDALGEHWTVLAIEQLLANGRWERTVVSRRRLP
jgi:23S rRNA U2552 (ribose-2'-O)-methylase RlmE/FtsJ